MQAIYLESFLGFSMLLLLLMGISYSVSKLTIGVCILVFLILMDVISLDKGSQFESWASVFKGFMLMGGVSVLLMLKLTQSEISVLILFVLLGSIALVSANDLLSIYVCLELQTLTTFMLVAKRRGSIISTEGGLKYFVLGALSSGLYLFGAGLVFASATTMNLGMISELPSNELLNLGKTFILIALLFKLAVAPFHFWAPDVYEAASLPMTALLVMVPKTAMFAAVLKLPFNDSVLLGVALLSVMVGAIGAMNQSKMKRLFAYSGVLNMGMVLVGLSLGTFEGAQSSLFYLLMYAVTAILGFSILSLFSKERLTLELALGMSSYDPTFAFLWALTFFSFAGIPPLLGFLGKWVILLSAIKEGYYLTTIIVLMFSVLAGIYYTSLIMLAYFYEGQKDFAWYIVLKNQAPTLGLSMIISVTSYLLLFSILCPNYLMELVSLGVCVT